MLVLEGSVRQTGVHPVYHQQDPLDNYIPCTAKDTNICDTNDGNHVQAVDLK